jgi:signal transduction histidine kinase
VSHELRNPLNSIIAKNIEKAALYIELNDHLNMFEEEIKKSETFRGCISILDKLDDGNKV